MTVSIHFKKINNMKKKLLLLFLIFNFGVASAAPVNKPSQSGPLQHCKKLDQEMIALSKLLPDKKKNSEESAQSAESLKQALEKFQKDCGGQTKAGCHPAQYQMLMGQMPLVEEKRKQSLQQLMGLREKIEKTQAELENCKKIKKTK